MSATIPSTYTRIVVPEAGDANVLKLETATTADTVAPSGADLLVKVAFAGINFIDTYFRSGLYKKPFPYSPGSEGSGIVIAAGPDVANATEWIGKRVAFYGSETGTYAQLCRVPAADAFIVPDNVDLKDAAALLLQGCTAHYLTHDSYHTKPGDVVLVQAAAGGTGLIVTQMAKHRGATVIGVCGGAEKAALAKSVGKCDFVIDYKATPDWEKEVLKLTDNKKCHVVYDGVGKNTFNGGLNSLRPRGTMVSFGNASGAVEPFAPLLLSAHGSLYLTRPKLGDYMLTREEQTQRVADVFDLLAKKAITLTIGKVFPLEEASNAQTQLEGQQTTGKLLLEVPQ